jgi:hypothetical protein
MVKVRVFPFQTGPIRCVELHRTRANQILLFTFHINVKYSWETEWFGHTLLCLQEEEIEERIVRFRTVGDMSCTAAVDSYAATIWGSRRN